jgi:hypothetical protein
MSDSLGLRDFHNVPHLDRTGLQVSVNGLEQACPEGRSVDRDRLTSIFSEASGESRSTRKYAASGSIIVAGAARLGADFLDKGRHRVAVAMTASDRQSPLKDDARRLATEKKQAV